MNQTLLHDSSSLGHGLDYAGPELVMAAVSLASQGWLVLAACGSIAQGDRKWPLLLLVTASTQSVATGRAFVICWILGKVSCLYDAFVPHVLLLQTQVRTIAPRRRSRAGRGRIVNPLCRCGLAPLLPPAKTLRRNESIVNSWLCEPSNRDGVGEVRPRENFEGNKTCKAGHQITHELDAHDKPVHVQCTHASVRMKEGWGREERAEREKDEDSKREENHDAQPLLVACGVGRRQLLAVLSIAAAVTTTTLGCWHTSCAKPSASRPTFPRHSATKAEVDEHKDGARG